MAKIITGFLLGLVVCHLIRKLFLKWQKREIELLYGLRKERQIITRREASL